MRKFYRNRSEGWGDTKIAMGLPATSRTPRRAGPSWGGGCRGRGVEGQPQNLRPSRLLSVFPCSLFSPHDLYLPSSDPLPLPPCSEPFGFSTVLFSELCICCFMLNRVWIFDVLWINLYLHKVCLLYLTGEILCHAPVKDRCSHFLMITFVFHTQGL